MDARLDRRVEIRLGAPVQLGDQLAIAKELQLVVGAVVPEGDLHLVDEASLPTQEKRRRGDLGRAEADLEDAFAIGDQKQP